jgi:UDP-N-acetylmuramyl pentapeptide synthase
MTIQLSGRHNLENACLALAVAIKCGIEPASAISALSAVAAPHLRGEIRQSMFGGEVMLDCYNANPQSMRAAVTTFVQRHPNGILALGDMLELGPDASTAHADLGEFVARSGRHAELIAIGDLSRHCIDGAQRAGLAEDRTHWCADTLDAVSLVSERCADGRALLLKGSRGMRLERIWDAISQSGRA